MVPHDKNQFFSDFLHKGAILRRGESEWYLWRLETDPGEFEKSKDISINYQNFFDSQMSGFWPLSQPYIVSTTELFRGLQAVLSERQPTIQQQHFYGTKPALFVETMKVIQGKIQRGEIEKAVPCVFARHENKPQPADLAHWIENLSKLPISLNVYGLWNENYGILGATPEILYHRRGSLIQSMALAGTCPLAQIAQRPSLLKDSKELFEHQLVVQDIEAQLSNWGRVQKSQTRILELPTLQHLLTELQVDGAPKEDIEIVKLLHPTPALGVAPRAYGYRWMQSLPEQDQRYLFGGPIVYKLSKEESLCLVAIRNIQWTKAGSWITAGCGIVSASEADREWQELSYKTQAIFQMLGIQ